MELELWVGLAGQDAAVGAGDVKCVRVCIYVKASVSVYMQYMVYMVSIIVCVYTCYIWAYWHMGI
jgi:hypothetical protein